MGIFRKTVLYSNCHYTKIILVDLRKISTLWEKDGKPKKCVVIQEVMVALMEGVLLGTAKKEMTFRMEG